MFAIYMMNIEELQGRAVDIQKLHSALGKSPAEKGVREIEDVEYWRLLESCGDYVFSYPS